MKRALILAALLVARAHAGPLRAVAIDVFAGPCAVDSAGKILCARAADLPEVDVTARSIVLGYPMLVIRDDGSVARVKVYPKGLEPIEVPFPVRAAYHIGRDHTLCVYGQRGELACGKLADNATKLIATPASTRFASVAIGMDAIWLLDTRGGLWCAGGSNCARLRTATGKASPTTPLLDPAIGRAYPAWADLPPVELWHVADGFSQLYAGDATCVVRAAEPGTLACWDVSGGPKAHPRPKSDELAIVGLNLCTRTGDAIECNFIDSTSGEHAAAVPNPPPSRFKVHGARRMYYGGLKFCVEDATGGLACTKIGPAMDPPAPVVWASPNKE